MAQHIIRDSKGRVEKILNDQEYAEYEKRGCYSNIIFWGVLIIGTPFLTKSCDSISLCGISNDFSLLFPSNR